MDETSWISLALPLAGVALVCLALLLPPRWRLLGGPLGAPLTPRGRAGIFLLLFTAMALLSGRGDPEVEWTLRHVTLDFGGTVGLLVVALLPAARGPAGAWRRAGFDPLPVPAVPWLLVLMASVAVFRIVLLTYVPCECPLLDPAELGWGRVMASAAFAGILAPLVEEVLYRGIALPLLAARAGGWGGILLTTVSWSMAHGRPPLLPFVAVGVALGWLTVATGSLWAAIGFHVAWNGAVVLYEIYDAVVGARGGRLPALVIFLAVVGLLLGWALLLDTARGRGLRVISAREQRDPSQDAGGKGGPP